MKNSPIVFGLFGYEYIVKAVHQALGYEMGVLSVHQFPDEEMVIRIDSKVIGSEVLFIGSLDRPNGKLAPLLFAAKTAKALGASSVGLVAPYLSYMRQDKQFHVGESITSKYFADIISRDFDWMITIDPHLHRWHSLNELYAIPTTSLHATNNIALWIKKNVTDPVLIGPDIESKQWVAKIAEKINAPFLILEKVRKGDNTVDVTIPQIELHLHRTPVLVDDIISTAATMMETIKHLNFLKTKPPICVGVHAVFSKDAYHNLLQSGIESVITCNTIRHPSNGIDICDIIINAL